MPRKDILGQWTKLDSAMGTGPLGGQRDKVTVAWKTGRPSAPGRWGTASWEGGRGACAAARRAGRLLSPHPPPRLPPPGTGPRSPLTGSRVWVLGSPRRPPRRTRAVAGASSPAQGCSGGGAEAAGRPTDPRLQGPLALWPPLRVGTRGPPIPFQRWPISWAQTRSADPDLPARGPAPGVRSRCLPVFSARLPSFPP